METKYPTLMQYTCLSQSIYSKDIRIERPPNMLLKDICKMELYVPYILWVDICQVGRPWWGSPNHFSGPKFKWCFLRSVHSPEDLLEGMFPKNICWPGKVLLTSVDRESSPHWHLSTGKVLPIDICRPGIVLPIDICRPGKFSLLTSVDLESSVYWHLSTGKVLSYWHLSTRESSLYWHLSTWKVLSTAIYRQESSLYWHLSTGKFSLLTSTDLGVLSTAIYRQKVLSTDICRPGKFSLLTSVDSESFSLLLIYRPGKFSLLTSIDWGNSLYCHLSTGKFSLLTSIDRGSSLYWHLSTGKVLSTDICRPGKVLSTDIYRPGRLQSIQMHAWSTYHCWLDWTGWPSNLLVERQARRPRWRWIGRRRCRPWRGYRPSRPCSWRWRTGRYPRNMSFTFESLQPAG